MLALVVCDNAADDYGELEAKVAPMASLMKQTNKKEFGFWLSAMEEWAAVGVCEILRY